MLKVFATAPCALTQARRRFLKFAVDLLVPDASYCEQIKSATCSMFSAVLAECGLPLPVSK